MTTKKILNPIDFVMMDVHRPMLNEEINEINPQARVDKSAGPVEDEHSASPEVGASYPHEQSLPENVAELPVETSHDIPPETILRRAFDWKLDEMVVCGIDVEGNEYVLHTSTDPAICVWHLQRAIHILNLRMDRRMMTKHGQDLDDHPNPAA